MTRLLMVGGDKRAQRLAELLKKDGFWVDTLGLFPGDKADIKQADALLFPYPYAVKQGNVPTLHGQPLCPEHILNEARARVPVLAGRGLEPYALSWEVMPKCFRLKKYEQVERFNQRNADLSAEAAVYEVMQRSEKALMDMKLLVTGYGLFARALAKRLRALEAKVIVAARKPEARIQAQKDGMEAVEIGQISQVRPEMVLNTVPAQILDEAALRSFQPDTWLMELASAPYGFDHDMATALGLKCALLPGLPAKYAPVSAAEALMDAALTLLEEDAQ